MATRSRIGIVNEDGSVLSIYCHWDGYTSNNGRLLVNHWTDPAKIHELIKLGSLSCLGEEIGEKHSFDPPRIGSPEYTDYEAKYGKMCLAYGRDRGEKNVSAQRHRNQQEFYENGEEYNYLFVNGKWTVQSYDRPQRLVEEALKERTDD